MTKAARKERLYWAYVSTSLLVTEGSRGRNLEAGADAEAVEEYCLLPCSPWPTFLKSPGPPGQEKLHPMGWALPHQSLIKKMPYRGCLQLNLREAFLN